MSFLAYIAIGFGVLALLAIFLFLWGFNKFLDLIEGM